MQIAKIIHESGDITIDLTEIKGIRYILNNHGPNNYIT
jgi:hypothetical protein